MSSKKNSSFGPVISEEWCHLILDGKLMRSFFFYCCQLTLSIKGIKEQHLQAAVASLGQSGTSTGDCENNPANKKMEKSDICKTK